MSLQRAAVACAVVNQTVPSHRMHWLEVPLDTGTTIRAVCVMLPATADTTTSLRRRLYADSLAKQVRLHAPSPVAANLSSTEGATNAAPSPGTSPTFQHACYSGQPRVRGMHAHTPPLHRSCVCSHTVGHLQQTRSLAHAPVHPAGSSAHACWSFLATGPIPHMSATLPACEDARYSHLHNAWRARSRCRHEPAPSRHPPGCVY